MFLVYIYPSSLVSYTFSLLSKINFHKKPYSWLSTSWWYKIKDFKNNPQSFQNSINCLSSGGDLPFDQKGLSNHWYKSIFANRFNLINTTRLDICQLYFAFDFRTVSNKMVINAAHTWMSTAFIEVPIKDFILRFCLIVLKNLCKALHNFFYAK